MASCGISRAIGVLLTLLLPSTSTFGTDSTCMASRPRDSTDMLAAGRGYQPVRKRSVPEAPEDASLVGAARDGDRGAFGRLYDLYARMVHGVLLARVPTGEVDDLVQDVFMMALRRLSTLRESGSFGAWLAAIARNLANDYHRRSVLADSTSTEDIGSGNTGGDDQVLATAILDVIRSLPAAYRETLILRLVEGMTGPEIAARTGMTQGSVRVNLHRGMQQLRAKLSSCQGSDRPQQETR